MIILEERSVGPGLGNDSISAGKIASVAGLIAVMVFMIATYWRLPFPRPPIEIAETVFEADAPSVLSLTV